MKDNLEIYVTIMRMVRKCAQNIHLKSSSIFDTEDLEQELFIHIIESLEKFDIRKGNILCFVRNILQNRSKDIIKAIFTDKRRIILKCQELTEDNIKLKSKDEFEDIFYRDEANLIPQTYREIILDYQELKKEEFYKKWKLKSKELNDILNAARLILETQSWNGVEAMRNISCIELLTVRELSKLSETDLADLSKKLKQTSGWVSSLEQKLETAVKIRNNARKSNNENN